MDEKVDLIGASVGSHRSIRRGLVMAGFVMLISLVAFGVRLLRPTSPTFTGLPYEPPIPGYDFALTDHHHRPVRLSDYRGKVVLLFFGFTHCPDACPTTLAHWMLVQRKLEAEAEQVRFVFITVDPERDTAEMIKTHLELFSPDFVGLRGSVDEIEAVAREYNAYIEKVEVDSALGYLVNHTALTYVIDQEGNLVLAFPYNTGSDLIVADLRYLLE